MLKNLLQNQQNLKARGIYSCTGIYFFKSAICPSFDAIFHRRGVKNRIDNYRGIGYNKDKCRRGKMVMSRRRMHQKDAIILAGLLGGVLLLLFSPLWGPMIWRAPASFSEPVAVSGQATKKEEKKETKEEQKQLPIVNEEGMTLAERINTPKGYTREEAEKGSLAEFLRKYSLKKSTGVVKTWDGKKAKDITNTPAVFKLPLAKENLQWAGGSVIRLYTEYLWENQMYDKISFQFSDGFAAQYQKWREGFRIRKDATGAIWVNGGELDKTRKNLEAYLHCVLTYTSVSTLEKETKKIKKDKLQTGDLFLDVATGDAAVVVDVCVNENGEKAFLLGKGGKPAKQFHLLTNPAHEEDPWYYESELQYPFVTSEGEFKKGSLRHPTYLD